MQHLEHVLRPIASSELYFNRSAFLHTWSDSHVLLGWIKSTKQQKIFVANRLTEISTINHQLKCHHILITLTPADYGARVLNPEKLLRNGPHLQHSGKNLETCSTIIRRLQQLWSLHYFFEKARLKKTSLNETVFDIKWFCIRKKADFNFNYSHGIFLQTSFMILKIKTNQKPTPGLLNKPNYAKKIVKLSHSLILSRKLKNKPN